MERFEDARLVTGAGAFVDALAGEGIRHIDTLFTPEKCVGRYKGLVSGPNLARLTACFISGCGYPSSAYPPPCCLINQPA